MQATIEFNNCADCVFRRQIHFAASHFDVRNEMVVTYCGIKARAFEQCAPDQVLLAIAGALVERDVPDWCHIKAMPENQDPLTEAQAQDIVLT